jgi:TonB family protein
MADTVLASGTLVLRRRSSGEPVALDPALEVGAGGEARVLRVPGEDGLVAKLYREPTIARAAKLARMIEAPPALQGGAALAWPVDLLTDPNGGRFAGFLMPRAEGPRVFELYNPVSRRHAAPLFDWGRLHRAGMSLSAAFDALHGCGYVVGDVNESNILVSPVDASVTLVDADSFQVRDPGTGAVYRSGVGKAEFTPPELQGARFADVDRAPEHDRFGLAVLLFLLLMEGTHPFAQRFAGDAESLPVEARIRRGLYPHARPDDDCRPPRLSPPIQTLHPGLQALFLRCFVGGHADPAARPSAAEWRDALALAAGELRPCDENPRHLFAGHIPFCPWCHRAHLLQGRDPFPVSLELARAADPALLAVTRPAPRPPALPSAPAPARAPSPALRPGPKLAPRTLKPAPFAAMLAPLTAFAAPLTAQLTVPQWIVGPAALGNPLTWAPPVALILFPGTPEWVRLLVLGLGALCVFPELNRRSVYPAVPRYAFTALTMMWMAVLVLLWSILTGVAHGSSAGVGVNPDLQPAPIEASPAAGAPADPASDPALRPIDDRAYDLSEVDVQPELENRDVVARVLSTAYPAQLRDAGVTGTVTVSFIVDRWGVPDRASTRVESTTHETFSTAAIYVVGAMRFRPAEKDGHPVLVRVTLPVTFQLQ